MKTIDLRVYRGNKKNLTIEVEGDHSLRNLSFVVKADRELTSNRLITKTTEILASYLNDKTQITIPLDAIDTQDLLAGKYHYDLDSTDSSNPSDTETVAGGKFNIEADVQTPFDGTDLPFEAKRYMPVFAELFLEGQFPRALKDLNGNLIWEGTYNIFGLLFEADVNGDLQPTADVIVEDPIYELDENNDIMPVN